MNNLEIKRINKKCKPISLNIVQKEFIKIFKNKVLNGEYLLKKNPCICESNNDLILSLKDRYGFDITTKICLNCGLLRSDPYYTDETLQKFYDNEYRKIYVGSEYCEKDFFKDQTEIGSRIFSFLSDFMFEKFTVLEIGCGAGGILNYFAKKGFKVTGCDFGSEYIEYGKQKGLDLFVGSIDDVKEKYDLIIINHVLEHIVNPSDFINKIKKILNQNGLLYIGVPGIDCIPEYYKYNLLEYLQNAHVYHYYENTLENLLISNGFELVSSNKYIQAVFKINKDIDKTNNKKINSKELLERIKGFEKIYLYNNNLLVKIYLKIKYEIKRVLKVIIRLLLKRKNNDRY